MDHLDSSVLPLQAPEQVGLMPKVGPVPPVMALMLVWDGCCDMELWKVKCEGLGV